MKKKEYKIHCDGDCLIKNLVKKNLMEKKPDQGKKSTVSPSCRHHLMFQNRCIPISCTNLSKEDFGSDFVNKSARLSLERICWTSIVPWFWRLWVKKNLGEICFVLSPLMYQLLSWAMHAVLSSNRTVGAILWSISPHDDRIYWIKLLSQKHSQLASWIASISAWLEEVAAIDCFVDLHDIVVPPYVNRYPI